ncbi:MAG: CBS domain-containing protein [Parasphingorhabdus sp.]|jgi:CBS domain-containing protein
MNDIPIIDNYMAKFLTTFRPTDDIHIAVKTLLEKHLSGASVVDTHGSLVGILSKKDCLKIVYSASYHQDWGTTVADYMSSKPETIESGTGIVDAADRFINSRFRRFPVMSNGRLIGQISRTDILQALYEQWS